MQTPKLLEGTKVLELANILAGPMVGMFLAELGAEVIKVENKRTGGDITRQWRLPSEPEASPISAYYCCANWGKKVHLLDLSDPEDLQQVHTWAAESDIVISNFKLSSAKRLQVDYESLKRHNEQLIYAQLTAFGEEDPRLGFDVVLQAETGYIYMTGEPEGNPVKLPVAFMDLLAAHQLKEGILCALLQKERTGKGAYIHTSLFASGIASLANQATNWLMGGHIPTRKGTQHPNIAPYGDMFETQDGALLVLAVGTDAQFDQLLHVLEVAPIPKFATNTQRVAHREELVALLQSHIKGRNSQELLPILHKRNIPAGQVRDMKEVFELADAKKMVLKETQIDGWERRCVQTTGFEIREP